MTIADVRNAKRPAKKAAKPSATAKPSAATVKSSAAAKSSAIAKPKQDLRAWIEALRAADELQEVFGAEREEEIGGIVDFYMRKIGNPAVLFDDVPGYPNGHRILANILTSIRRINLTLGLPADGSEIELVSIGANT